MPNKEPLGIKDLSKFLTQNTATFLSKEMAKKQQRLADLTQTTEDSFSNRHEIQQLREAIQVLTLQLDRQVYVPREQKDYISLGSGVTVLIGTVRKNLFVDSIHVGKCRNIVSLGSPLGSAIFGKKVGDSGSYRTESGFFNYEVLEILPYSEAKKILKGNEKTADIAVSASANVA